MSTARAFKALTIHPESRIVARMTSGLHNIWSVPAGAPFLKTLARAVLGGGFPSPDMPAPGPSELSAYTILVPTRRAARELAAAFLNVSDGAALLLPRIQTLGDVDEEELSLSPAQFDGAADIEISAAISPLRRQLILARLLTDWARDNRDIEFSAALLSHPSQAVEVAADLGQLIDQLETEEISLDQLQHVVAENFATYWLEVLKVLDVVRTQLPAELSARGMIGPAERRNRLLRAEADRLSALNPQTPYIAAGSTGSIPATANLLKAIAGLPNGAVVLPGLDEMLDEESWATLDAQHPQYGLHELLENLGVDRDHVRQLNQGAQGSSARRALFSETMRPSETTHLWQSTLPSLRPVLHEALENLTAVRASGRREEALCIALKMREAAEFPGRTAALITPDRDLGRRVSAHLKRWNLNVDDSAGVPLSRTLQGTFLDLIMSALEAGFSAHSFSALCSHPLARFGLPPGAAARSARKLELAILRGVAPSRLASYAAALASRRKDVAKKPNWFAHLATWDDRDWTEADTAARMVGDALAHLTTLASADQPMPLQVAVETIVKTAETIAADETGHGSALWNGEAGEQLSQFFSSLMEAGEDCPLIAPSDLRRVMMGLMAQSVVRPRYGTHPRLHILGLLEARMTDHDVVILGGLNEKIWPAQTQSDVWLNRPMRTDLGLASPERRMGLSAHDFVQAVCSDGPVYLTFSDKHEGAPAVPSRWLLRLAAILEALNGPDIEAAGRDVLASVLGLDHVGHTSPVPRPAPTPALDLRPRRLSITEIETWLRDPYAIFARHILRLSPLEELGLAPGPRERGMLFHEIFEEFSTAWASALPDDIAGELERIGQACFAAWQHHPEVIAFWWPRFVRVAAAAAEIERRLRQDVDTVHVETSGKLSVSDGPDGGFVLTGRADRIDIFKDGRARLIDYKTGAPPGVTEALTGKAPQLLLEAIMVAEGAFKDVPRAQVSELLYLQLSGGTSPIDERRLDPARAKPKIEADLHQVCSTVYEKLQRHIARYNSNPHQPYLPRVLPKYKAGDMTYDHLSRYLEWSSFAEEGDEAP